MFNEAGPSIRLVERPDRRSVPDPLACDAAARARLHAQLDQSAALRIIADVLNGLERRRAVLPLCRLGDRDLKDMQRLIAKAKAIVRSVDPDVEGDAVDDVAQILCDGPDGEYAPFDQQPSTVQARYRRWAQHAINAYWVGLEGRGDARATRAPRKD